MRRRCRLGDGAPALHGRLALLDDGAEGLLTVLPEAGPAAPLNDELLDTLTGDLGLLVEAALGLTTAPARRRDGGVPDRHGLARLGAGGQRLVFALLMEAMRLRGALTARIPPDGPAGAAALCLADYLDEVYRTRRHGPMPFPTDRERELHARYEAARRAAEAVGRS